MTSATAPLPACSGPAVGEPGLTPEQLEHFAVFLEGQRSTLVERAARLGVDIEQLLTLTATHGQGETEHTVSGSERAVVELLEAGTLEALEEIALALTRIDDGSYGICTGCGVRIGTARLLAIPQTEHCVTCRRTRERRGR